MVIIGLRRLSLSRPFVSLLTFTFLLYRRSPTSRLQLAAFVLSLHLSVISLDAAQPGLTIFRTTAPHKQEDFWKDSIGKL
ncbi:hypothetical protein MRB53_030279 [Persea americana]|uniref:Uncharacterized protein n=1 Tax=Persea americana TaxID=3435 RepID=A0ACC2KKT1_PERAE|nr:hypothetical protein MRB53_030279 [Persea americana]